VIRVDWPQPKKIVIQLVFYSIGILVNFLFFFILAKMKVRRSNIILVFLALADIVVCIAQIFLASANWYRTWAFGDIGCDIIYGVLYTSYLFIGLTLISTFVLHLFFKTINTWVSAIFILLLLTASVLINLYHGTISIFVEVMWNNDSLCTAKLDLLLEARSILRITELFIPLGLLAFFIICRLFENLFKKEFTKRSGFFGAFFIMLMISIAFWCFKMLFERHDLIVLDIFQCLNHINRPFILVCVCRDLRNALTKLVTGKDQKEEVSRFEFPITKVDDNV
jgi:hypothetical protein